MKSLDFPTRLIFCYAFTMIMAFLVFSLPSHAQSQQDEYDKADTLHKDGEQRFNVSDFRGAIVRWEEALFIVKQLGRKKAISVTMGNLGLAHRNLGDNLKAIDYHKKALTISEEIGDKQGKGAELNNLGLAYFAIGDYRKAIICHEQALAIAEEIRHKGVKGNNLINLGSVYLQLGDYSKAISYYEQALAIAKESGYKKGEEICLGNLGSVHQYSGDFRKAISYHEQALAIAEEIGDKQNKGLSLGNLGSDYYRLGDYSKSINYYEQALAIAEEIGHKQSIGITLGNLGASYMNLGDPRKAILYQERSIAIAGEIGDKHVKGAVLCGLGVSHSNLGDYLKAISIYEEAISLSKEIGVSYHSPEGNLGDAYLALDRDEEAFAIFTKQNHHIRLGRFYLKKKEYQKAKEQFERDRIKYQEAKRADMILGQRIGLGLSHEGLTEYDKAYDWFKKAIAFMEEQRSALIPAEREHYFEGKEFGFPRIEAYEGAVRCAFMLGKLDEAFYWAENTRGRVLSELLSRRHSGADFRIPSALAQEEEELTTQIIINKKQQQVAFEKNNPDLLKRTEDAYPLLKQKMENLIDHLRRKYPQYAAIKYPLPVKLPQLTLKQGETIIEYEVTDPYTVGLVIRKGSVIKAFKVDKTRAELEMLVSKYRSPFQEGGNIKSFSLNLAKELTDLLLKPALPVLTKGEHLIIIPDESLSLLPFEALLIAAPASALKEEAMLLAQTAKQTDSGIKDKATIIRGLTQMPATRSSGVSVPPRVTTHILFDTDSAQIKNESEKQLHEMTAALKSKELKNAAIRIEGHTDSVGNPKYNMKLSMERAQAIYDYLTKSGVKASRLNFTGKGDTEPVADNQDEKGRKQNRRVDFVRTDGPSAAQKVPSSQTKEFIYAMDEYPISYYQSASVLSLQRGLHISRTKEQSFFGLGDPIFDTKDNRASDQRAVKIVGIKAGISSKDIADNEETKDAGYRFSRLVNTEREVKEVGRLFNMSKMMLGSEATEANLKAEDLTARKYVLFSTHGILGSEIPYIKQPAMVLSLIGNDKENGFLTASEIFNMNLNADIVVLSACKTGLGVQSAGEGVVGLSRAFMYAGTDTVLVSLWSVSDESTYKLMVKFFSGVKNGKDKMSALKDAKNYLRTSGYVNPFYWAPFILVGEAN